MLHQCLPFCIIGLSIGYLYGLSFIYFKRRAFLLARTTTKRNRWYLFIAPTLIRLTLFLSAFYYLVHTTRVHFLLSLLCFVVAFWMTILHIKVDQHDKS